MRKILIASMVLLSSVTHAGNNKSMVSFDVGDIVRGSGGFNTHLSLTDTMPFNEMESNAKSLLVNYAYEIIPQIQLRVILGINMKEALNDKANDLWDRTNTTTLGAGLLYNFSSDLMNSYFFGVNYLNQKIKFEKDMLGGASAPNLEGSITSYIIEAGKRFKMGTLSGMSFTWSPTLSYSLNSFDKDITTLTSQSGIEKNNELKINLLKVDMIF